MAEINPVLRSRILWKTKRQQRMGVIVNALHALIAFSCFCFMHVDTGYDWGLAEGLRTYRDGRDIRDKIEAIAKSEGYKSVEDFMWDIKSTAKVVSVIKQVSFAYCLLSVLKLVTSFPMFAPIWVMKKKDYLPIPPKDPYPHAAWNFELIFICVALFVYFWSCICVLGAQFDGQMPKPLWPFIVGAALGMLASLTPLAYGCVSIMSPPESPMMSEVSHTSWRLIDPPAEQPTGSGNDDLLLCLSCLECLCTCIEIAE